MRNYIAYAVALLCTLLLAPSCSKEAPGTDTGNGTGTLVMKISATRTDAADGYDPFDYTTVRIFDGRNELIRKYTSIEALPASLELLAGNYRIAVEAGDNSKATFTNRTYKGEAAFTIAAGKTEKVQVECLLVNTVVEVVFDKSVAQTFSEKFHAWVMASDTFDQTAAGNGSVPALKYTSDAKGYFILPEGVTTFSCRFEGEHPQRGTIVHAQSIENVKPQGKYKLTYKFSPDLPGFISLETITVDTSEDEEDDTIIFSPDPTLTGVGFNAEEAIRHTSGDKSFIIASTAALQHANLTDGEVTYDLMNDTNEGITVVKNNANSLTLTLSEAFLANHPAGEHLLHFVVSDVGNGSLSTDVALRLQGMLPIQPGDYNTWTNTLVLRAVSFDTANGVKFGLREKDGTWREQQGAVESPDIYTTTYAPEWDQKNNEHGIPIFSFKSNTGIFAGKTYECRATIGSSVHTDEFTTAAGDVIPNGDMEGNLSCFGTSNTGTTTWGSGNNSMAKGLCVKAPASEMGGIGGSQCAKMVSSKPIAAVKLAAGNLFFATFSFSGIMGPGTVSFGQKYVYTARPSKLAVKYHAKVGKVTANDFGGPLAIGSQDISTIYVCIIDWSARKNVVSGTSGPSGLWDPTEQTNLAGYGEIIAYGRLDINETTEGNSLVQAEIPLNFYNTSAGAPTGNYTLTIACSSNKYGDSMNGCDSNVMYVDDFEWVY